MRIGALSGSLTRLKTGESYLIAGNNVTITTASNGSVTIASTASASPGGSDTYIQFNDGGTSFGGDSGLTYNKTTDSLTIVGDITGSSAVFSKNLTVLGTASFSFVETLNQQSLIVGDKYITILSGATDHTSLDGSGILFGSGSIGPTVNELGSNAHVRYRSTLDAVELFPGLKVSGSAVITNSLTITGSLTVSGSQAYVALSPNGNTTSNTTINWNSGNVQNCTLNANPTTFTFSNGKSGATYILIVKQNSAGSYTINWPGAVSWPGASAPTMTAGANKYDVYSFVYDGTTYFAASNQNYT